MRRCRCQEQPNRNDKRLARKVIISAQAARDLRAARLWLLQPGSGRNRAQRWNALREVPRRLKKHPFLGQAYPLDSELRQLVVSGYRVIYSIIIVTGPGRAAGDLEILRLYGPGQDNNAP